MPLIASRLAIGILAFVAGVAIGASFRLHAIGQSGGIAEQAFVQLPSSRRRLRHNVEPATAADHTDASRVDEAFGASSESQSSELATRIEKDRHEKLQRKVESWIFQAQAATKRLRTIGYNVQRTVDQLRQEFSETMDGQRRNERSETESVAKIG